ncbi:MAG: DUF4175 family protein [Elusimicrobia bacterium]|nr:DUF4175 family protein [Candidatus Obscuribacterium magneticum]
MTTPSTIIRFSRTATYYLILMAGVRGLLKALPTLLISFLFMSGFDQWLIIQASLRQFIWLFALLLSGILFVSGFRPFSIFKSREKSRHLWLRSLRLQRWSGVQPFRRDDLRLAEDLLGQQKKEGISSELKGLFLDQLASRLEKIPPWWCFPRWRWKEALLMSLSVLFIGGSLWAFFPTFFPFTPRVYYPFVSSDIHRCLTIEPGNASLPWGQDADIRVTMLIPSVNKPVLYVKTESDWLPMEPEKEVLGSRTYRLAHVIQPLQYRVKWKKEWSSKFTLTPLPPLQLKNVSVTVNAPDYVKKEPQIQLSLEISGLAGSLVMIQAQSSENLRSARVAFSHGREIPFKKIKKSEWAAEFSLEKSGTYGFLLESETGLRSGDANAYPLHVLEDQTPFITLLSPDDDLIIGEKEKLPLTFEAKDDYGVREVTLIWKKDEGRSETKRIASLETGKESWLSSYDWNLAEARFQPGDVIHYQLEAVDGNLITGPGKAFTEWRIIEIASFETTHKALEEALDEWRNKAIDLLADVNNMSAQLNMDTPKYEDLSNDFNRSMANAQQLEGFLKQIVSQMEKDPLADYGVWLEHKSMRENLSQMNAGPMTSAGASLQTKNKEAASAFLNEVASELERMTALSGRLSKSQKARDVIDAGDKLSELGEDLLNQLESAAAQGEPVDNALMNQINDLLSEAQKILMNLTDALKKFPEELPDDFINQESLKEVDIGKSQDLMSAIAEALQKGDLKKALALAKDFLKAAQAMRDQLNKAHESFTEKNSAGELAKRISDEQKALESLIEKERDLLSKTQQLDSKRMAVVLNKQKDLLAQLAERQKKVVDKTTHLVQKGKLSDPIAAGLGSQIKPMQEVADEMFSLKCTHTLERLPVIIGGLKNVESEIQRSSFTISAAKDIAGLRIEEEDILSALKKPVPPEQIYSKEEMAQFPDLQKKQEDLAEKTQNLKKNLQGIAQQTASLGVAMMQALSKARTSMGSAAQELGNKASFKAQQHEENALNNLSNSLSMLEQAQNDLSEMAMEGGEGKPGGGGGSGAKVLLRGTAMGSRGAQNAPVKLPTIKDYRPPKEFREELLEALKEKYPKTYEEIIHKYFKRLSE